MRSGDDERADLQRAPLHEHSRDGAAAPVKPRLDHGSFRASVRIGGEIEQFGLQGDRLEQLIEIGSLGRRHFHRERVAAKRLNLHVVLQQLLHHPLGIGFGLVDLVDGDDDRGPGGLRVPDRLDRLGHDFVVGRHDQHDDVGDFRAPRAHRCERGVTGGVDEGDGLAAGGGDLIGADVLSDAARFASDHIRMADRIKQRGLAVVDMAHDRDDRGPRDRRAFVVGPIEQAFLDIELGDALDRMAQFLGHKLSGVGVEHVSQRHHAALAHQKLDDVDRALRHAARELLDGDRLRQDDLTRNFFLLLLRAVTFQPLRAPSERGDRTGALLLPRSRAGDGQPAAIALLAGAGRPRRRHDDLLPRRQRERRTPDDPPRFFVFAARGSGERSWQGGAGRGLGRAGDRRRWRGFAAGKASSRFILRLPFEAGFLRAAQLLLALARFRGVAFEAVAGLAFAPGLGVRLLAAAILLLMHARIVERPRARLSLLGRKGGKHDAGLGRRRSGGPCRGDRSGPRGARKRRLRQAWRNRRRGGGGRRPRPRDRRRLSRRQNPPLYLLDDDRLAAAMREALPYRALLDRALQVQSHLGRRGRHSLIAITRLTHAYS